MMNSFFKISSGHISSDLPISHDPILCYTSIFHEDEIITFTDFTREQVTEDEKLSKIGLIRGIIEFSSKFDDSTHVKYIDTEKQRFIIGSINENGRQIIAVLGLKLGYKTVGDKIEYNAKKANREYLMNLIIRGLKNFELNHGDILQNKDTLNSWWGNFIKVLVNIIEQKNLLKEITCKFELMKNSSLVLPTTVEAKIDNIRTNDEIYINVICIEKEIFENYGIIYQSNEFKYANDLIQYLQFIDLQNGITLDTILSDNLIMPDKIEPTKDFFKDVYPFNATVDAVNTVSEYLPNFKFWGHEDEHIQEVEEENKEGFILGDKIYKIIYFDNVAYQLLLYRIDNFIICLVYNNNRSES